MQAAPTMYTDTTTTAMIVATRSDPATGSRAKPSARVATAARNNWMATGTIGQRCTGYTRAKARGML